MQSSISGSSNLGNFTGLSLDGIFLLHFLQALERLQVYLGEGGGDEGDRWMRVSLQFEYIKHLLPKEVQQKVHKLVDEREQELKVSKEYKGEYAPLYVARMQIVSETVGYLTASLDLTHEDIVASLTPRAREHATGADEVIELV